MYQTKLQIPSHPAAFCDVRLKNPGLHLLHVGPITFALQ